MPLAQRTVMFFGMLLISIPVQYFISEYFKSNDPHKAFLEKLRYGFKRVEEMFFSILSFRARFEQEALLFFRDWGNEEKKEEESGPVSEALKLQSKTANQLGLNRPDSVLFRVGDVVIFRQEGHRGVIIAWHLDPNGKNEAQYTILLEEEKKSDIVSGVHGRELLRHYNPIMSKFLRLYFLRFDGYKFIPQAWLKERFPKD